MGSTSFLRSRLATAALLIGTSFLFAVRLFLLVYQKSVNILFWDQWDFLTPLFQGQKGWTLFITQIGSHRMGIGYFLIQLLAGWTHWNTRADSFAILALVVLAMLGALVLKKRVFGSLSAWDVLIPAIFLTVTQYEIFIGVPNESAGALPLFLLIVFCLAWTIDRMAVRLPIILIINFLMIFTGYGFLIAPVTIAIFGLELYKAIRGQSRAAAIAAGVGLLVSIGSILFYFRGFQFGQASQCYGFSASNLVKYPVFMGVTFAKFVGLDYSDQRWISIIFGCLILAMVVGALIYQGVKLLALNNAGNKVSLSIIILTSYGLIFSASAAVGRMCLGMTGASSSRYVTLIIPAFLGLYFFLLTIGRPRTGRLALVILVLIALLGQLPFQGHDLWVIHFFSEDKASWKACYLTYEDVKRCNQLTDFQIYTEYNARLQTELDYLKQHHLNLYLDDLSPH